MSIITGIDNINENKGGARGNRPSFLRVPKNSSVIVRFLQELSDDHQYYDEDAGLGALAVEYRHPDPDKFKLRALDTSAPELGGKCWMAEQGWKPRKSLYILVEQVDGENAGEIAILNQGFGKSTVSDSIIEFAREYGTLRDRPYKVTRTGQKWNDTNYTIIPLKEDDSAVTEDVLDRHREEIVDWEDVLRLIPYEEQEAYFTRGDDQKTVEPQSVDW